VAGSLVIVGTGIQFGQLTLEARAQIEHAEKVLFLVVDDVTEAWITNANPTAESLQPLRRLDEERRASYERMARHIVSHVRSGEQVCAAFYGHPGIGVVPSHRAIQLAREEGFRASVLPGVCAEDCLAADLDIDLLATGRQSYEATRFLMYRAQFDRNSPLILWQISAIGNRTNAVEEVSVKGLELLIGYLIKFYGAAHEVVVYEAARYPVCKPLVHRVALSNLCRAPISQRSTLYVPPRYQKQASRWARRWLQLPQGPSDEQSNSQIGSWSGKMRALRTIISWGH
jgi:siroheme synthase